MLSEVKARFYANKRIYDSVPIIFQTECILAFEDILKDLKEEYPNATLSELFNADE